ncbi:flagellar protein FlaG [Alkalibacterium olivapovliticus]|uniref:Flagellar protein FlaG n=1 Tax=Alkalibacterium olivapovliticus TaxID=99907 RepID=A0A2T0VYT4_9LACT|nr:flagellar protein FlaG [Alkalibacterium olivapovliticus]PRY77493.1 flagellar protein FlaG [Alkalibacterium olivapovliticus]
MSQRVNSIDALKTIDRVLHSNKSTVSYSGDRYIDPIKAIEGIDTSFDRVQYEPQKEQVQKWVDEAQSVLQRVNAQLSFKTHEGTGRTLVQVIDKETEEVIREIPPEKMLDMIAGIWQWSGLVVDRTE